MASQQTHSVFPHHDIHDDDQDTHDDDDDDEDDDDADEQDLNSTSPSSSSAAPALPFPDPSSAVTVAVPGTAVPNAAPIHSILPDSKRLHVLTIHPDDKKPLDESRRLFQRLWTDDDEIQLLRGFLHYSTQRGSTHHHDTALFYDQIKSKFQLHFNKNQLVDKLRRLKKKYRTVLIKLTSGKDFSFKSPHDQATFEISSKIWSDTAGIAIENTLDDDESNPNPNSNPSFNICVVKDEEIAANTVQKKTPRPRKRPRSQSGMGLTSEKPVLMDVSASKNNNNGDANNMVELIEKTVKTSLSPLFKELLGSNTEGGPSGAREFRGMALSPMPFSLGERGSINFGRGEVLDEKWRKQQILELEVYSKRLELVQDQIKMTLAELLSARGS